jgi:hypothetical protein
MIVNDNSICKDCRRLSDCLYKKALRSDCPYFIRIELSEFNDKFLCQFCGWPTTPTGKCRTCTVCGETTGCG